MEIFREGVRILRVVVHFYQNEKKKYALNINECIVGQNFGDRHHLYPPPWEYYKNVLPIRK